MKFRNLLKVVFLSSASLALFSCGETPNPTTNTGGNPTTADTTVNPGGDTGDTGKTDDTGTVSDQHVASIAVEKMPTKVSYVIGDSFDPTGGVLKVTYEDKSTKQLDMSDSRITYTALNSKSVGSKTIKATFGGKSVSFKVTVTKEMISIFFNSNGGSEVNPVEVEKGKTLELPDRPTKAGFVFDGWFTDEELTLEYDVNTVIETSFTLNAKWLEEGKEIMMVTFDYGYYGAIPESRVLRVEKGNMVRAISVEPTRKGYDFGDWFKDGAAYNFNEPVEDSIVLTANWVRSSSEYVGQQTYIFEAEDVDFTGIVGKGLSGTATETACIINDGNYGASNDRYVSYLYQMGLGLKFQLNCDVKKEGVTFVARLSQFIEDYSYTAENWAVYVNGEEINYPEISFTNVPAMQDSTATPLPFADFNLGNIDLKAGNNTIELITNNTDAINGTTMEAHAPLIDCIKFTADDFVLDWDGVKGYPYANY